MNVIEGIIGILSIKSEWCKIYLFILKFKKVWEFTTRRYWPRVPRACCDTALLFCGDLNITVPQGDLAEGCSEDTAVPWRLSHQSEGWLAKCSFDHLLPAFPDDARCSPPACDRLLARMTCEAQLQPPATAWRMLAEAGHTLDGYHVWTDLKEKMWAGIRTADQRHRDNFSCFFLNSIILQNAQDWSRRRDRIPACL